MGGRRWRAGISHPCRIISTSPSLTIYTLPSNCRSSGFQFTASGRMNRPQAHPVLDRGQERLQPQQQVAVISRSRPDSSTMQMNAANRMATGVSGPPNRHAAICGKVEAGLGRVVRGCGAEEVQGAGVEPARGWSVVAEAFPASARCTSTSSIVTGSPRARISFFTRLISPDVASVAPFISRETSRYHSGGLPCSTSEFFRKSM